MSGKVRKVLIYILPVIWFALLPVIKSPEWKLNYYFLSFVIIFLSFLIEKFQFKGVLIQIALFFLFHLILLFKMMCQLNLPPDHFYLLEVILLIDIFSFLFVRFFYKKLKEEEMANELTYRTQEEECNLLKQKLKTLTLKKEGLLKEIKTINNLREVVSLIGGATNREEIIKNMVEATGEILKSDITFFSIKDNKKQFIVEYIKPEKYRLEGMLSDNLDEWIFSRGMPVVIENVKKEARIKIVRKNQILPEVQSIIATPVKTFQNFFGILRCERRQKEPFSQEELRILTYIGELGAIMLETVYYIKEIERLAITDGITGLYVHRYLLERLEQEVERFKKFKSPVSLIMMDIDDFKRFNDRYGHQFGDRVLEIVSAIIKNNIREIDCGARYGGDEFAIILPHTDVEGAITVGKRLFDLIRSYHLYVENPEVPPEHRITVSMGIGEMKKEYKDWKEFLNNVDKALYKSKTSGKDKIEVVR